MAQNVSEYTIKLREEGAKEAAANAAKISSEYRQAAEAVKAADAAYREAAKAAREADKAARPAAKARAEEAKEAARAAREAAAEKKQWAKQSDSSAARAAKAVDKDRVAAAKATDRQAKDAARAAKQAERADAKRIAQEARARKQADAEAKRSVKRKAAEEAKAAREAAKSAAQSAKGLQQGLQQAGGSMSGLIGQLGSLKNIAGAGRAGVIGLAVALAVALVAGAVAAYAALVRLAFAAASVVRETRLLAGALTGNSRLADEFVAVVDQLAAEVPLAKDQIRDLAREMSLLRLGRRDMQAGMASIAIVSSAIGDAAGNAVKSIVQQSAAIKRFTLGARNMYGEWSSLTGTGLKERDVLAALAEQMKTSIPEVEKALLLGRVKMADGLKALEAAARAKFGKTVAAQMLAFDVQVRKAKENLAGMFAGVYLEPALRGLQEVLSIVDTTTVSGKAMQQILTTGINAVSSAIGAAAPIAKKFFQGMAIAALQVYIAIKPIARAVGEAIGSFNKSRASLTALEAGKTVFLAIAGAIAAAAAVAALLAIPLAGLATVIGIVAYAFAQMVSKAVATTQAIYGALKGAYDAVKGMSWGEIGTAIVDGIANAIKAGASKVANAALSMAQSAKDAVKGALGIASPSKVFAQLGQFTAEGFTVGVDKGAPAAQAATEQMVQPPTPAGGGAPAAPPAIGGVVVNFNGPVTLGSGKDEVTFAAWLIDQIRTARLGGPTEADT